ncbi:MAG: hypothetical protein P4M07_12035 [Xanthobacteraceae bacterium]|nr:hypothetical protein [Xanthobacteraceae bacterium]
MTKVGGFFPLDLISPQRAVSAAPGIELGWKPVPILDINPTSIGQVMMPVG